MTNTAIYETTLKEDETFGLGEVRILHPPGTFALTPASLISIHAIVKNQHLLSGIGIDWGSGTGCLSIVASRIATVNKVFGLEISDANVNVAWENARLNRVGDKVTFMRSNSYLPFSDSERKALEDLKSRVNFILANPPSSEGDDGFAYRRIILRGGKEYLRDGGIVFLSISYQYGLSRIERLTTEVPGFVHGGILATTDWFPFDLDRPDLLHCLELYAQEEMRGGLEYTFSNPGHAGECVNAQTALELFHKIGRSPLSKWQTHLFKYQRQ